MNAILDLIESLLVWIGLSGRVERVLADAAHGTDVRRLRGEITADERRFEEEMARRAGAPHLVVGRANAVDYLLRLRDLVGSHGHIVAQPGAGKTRLIVALLAQLLEHMWFRGASHAAIVVDPKGETVLVLLRAVAELLSHMNADVAAATARRIVVIRPFLGRFLVPLNLMAREPSVDLVAQARVLVELVERTAGVAVGIRQGVAGAFGFAVLIANGISLVEAPFLMRDANVMRDLAMQVDEPRLRAYFAASPSDYARESRTTINGLLARIEAILGIAPLRAMLAGAGGFDFRALFAPGMLTIIDLDGAPLGAQAIADAIGAMLLTRVGWAAFSHGGERAEGTWLVVDELGRMASPSVIDATERVLTQGRWRGLGMLSAAQFSSQTQELDRLLSANTRFRLFGRSSEREIEGAATEWLPVTGRRPRARRPGELPRPAEFMSEAEEIRDAVRRIARLPQRTFLVGERGAPFVSRLIEAPRIEPAAWHTIPDRVRELVERGGFGVPREELLARARRLEAEAAERLTRARDAASPTRERRPRARPEPPMPDLAERTRGRRRREVP